MCDAQPCSITKLITDLTTKVAIMLDRKATLLAHVLYEIVLALSVARGMGLTQSWRAEGSSFCGPIPQSLTSKPHLVVALYHHFPHVSRAYEILLRFTPLPSSSSSFSVARFFLFPAVLVPPAVGVEALFSRAMDGA